MKKKKITEEQMSLFKEEVRNCIETNVIGGHSTYLDLWRRNSKHTGDMEFKDGMVICFGSKYLSLGYINNVNSMRR